jgi:hypothetical protein
LEEFGEGHAGAAEEGAVAAATVHEFGRQFAAELQAGLDDEAWEPGDAVDGIGLGGEGVGWGWCSGRTTAEDFVEVAVADALDVEDDVEAGFTPSFVVLDEVEEFLGRATDLAEELDFVWIEKGIG